MPGWIRRDSGKVLLPQPFRPNHVLPCNRAWLSRARAEPRSTMKSAAFNALDEATISSSLATNLFGGLGGQAKCQSLITAVLDPLRGHFTTR